MSECVREAVNKSQIYSNTLHRIMYLLRLLLIYNKHIQVHSHCLQKWRIYSPISTTPEIISVRCEKLSHLVNFHIQRLECEKKSYFISRKFQLVGCSFVLHGNHHEFPGKFRVTLFIVTENYTNAFEISTTCTVALFELMEWPFVQPHFSQKEM